MAEFLIEIMRYLSMNHMNVLVGSFAAGSMFAASWDSEFEQNDSEIGTISACIYLIFYGALGYCFYLPCFWYEFTVAYGLFGFVVLVYNLQST